MKRLIPSSWSLHLPRDSCSWPLLQLTLCWARGLLCPCLEVLQDLLVSLPATPPAAPSSFQALPAESAWEIRWAGAPASSVSSSFRASHVQKWGMLGTACLIPAWRWDGGRWTNIAYTVLPVWLYEGCSCAAPFQLIKWHTLCAPWKASVLHSLAPIPPPALLFYFIWRKPGSHTLKLKVLPTLFFQQLGP